MRATQEVVEDQHRTSNQLKWQLDCDVARRAIDVIKILIKIFKKKPPISALFLEKKSEPRLAN